MTVYIRSSGRANLPLPHWGPVQEAPAGRQVLLRQLQQQPRQVQPRPAAGGQEEQPGQDQLRQRGPYRADAAARLKETERHVRVRGSLLSVSLYCSNPVLPCHSLAIPRLDLTHWTEQAKEDALYSDVPLNSLLSEQPSDPPVGYFQDQAEEQSPFETFNVNSIFSSSSKRDNHKTYDLKLQYPG